MPWVACRDVVVGAVCATVYATDDYLRWASSHCARTLATAEGDLPRCRFELGSCRRKKWRLGSARYLLGRRGLFRFPWPRGPVNSHSTYPSISMTW